MLCDFISSKKKEKLESLKRMEEYSQLAITKKTYS